MPIPSSRVATRRRRDGRAGPSPGRPTDPARLMSRPRRATCVLPMTSRRPSPMLERTAVPQHKSGRPHPMNRAQKLALIILGVLSALLVLSQLILGQLVLGGRADLIKSHQHTGYLTVCVGLVYILFSLISIARLPTRPGGP